MFVSRPRNIEPKSQTLRRTRILEPCITFSLNPDPEPQTLNLTTRVSRVGRDGCGREDARQQEDEQSGRGADIHGTAVGHYNAGARCSASVDGGEVPAVAANNNEDLVLGYVVQADDASLDCSGSSHGAG